MKVLMVFLLKILLFSLHLQKEGQQKCLLLKNVNMLNMNIENFAKLCLKNM